MHGSHDALFRPKRVAVVGASTTPAKWGHRVLRTLRDSGFPGEVAGVSRRAGEILGYRVYPRASDLPWVPDVAVVAVGRDEAVGVVSDLAALGCRYAVVHTSGFAETGPEGQALQDRMVRQARACGTRLLGPNCMNLMVSSSRLNLTGIPDLPPGRLAFVSQSGNLVYEVIEYARIGGPGLSSFISVGNQADLGIEDLLDDLVRDSDTSAVVLYIEGLRPGRGREFLAAARRLVAAKPVVALLGGRHDGGRRASASHTASLLHDARVLQGLLRQAGVIEVERLDDLLPTAEALINCPSPSIPTVVLCGSGGGHATVGGDAFAARGVALPAPGPETTAALGRLLPPASALGNPIDWVGASARDAGLYEKVGRFLLADSHTGGLVFFGHFGGYVSGDDEPPQEYCDVAEALGRLQQESGKPILVHSVYWRQDRPAFRGLRRAGIPLFASLDVAAAAFAALARRSQVDAGRRLATEQCRDDLIEPYVRHAHAESRRVLLEPEALSWLAELGLPVPLYSFARTRRAAAEYAARVGVQVAVKLVSPNVLHKSDVGGVQLGLADPNAVAGAFSAMERLAADAGMDFRGVLVVPMAGPGVEVAVGVAQSPIVGHTLVFASGGTAIEALDDAAIRPAPISAADAAEMIHETRAGRLLERPRGLPPPPLGPLRTLMVQLSEAVAGSRHVEAIDLNPVLVSPSSIVILDARVILRVADRDPAQGSDRP